MRGVPLTPEQRAERAAARRALARRVALRSALGTLALGIVVVALLYWLLTTVGGRDVLLSQIVARLPAGASLTWSRAEGPARGPLVLHDVRFSYASPNLHYGVGIGARWRSPVGPVRVDIARGLTGPDAGFTLHFNIGADL